MTKGLWYAIEYKWNRQLSLSLEFKGYWKFRETSDVTCIESKKKTLKTMHCSETWKTLIYIDF